jgi:hypothetical protein
MGSFDDLAHEQHVGVDVELPMFFDERRAASL